jgi:hypothetical protein
MHMRTRKLTLSAMFVALGILLPIVFHALGLGSIFLPMFWPIAAGAFFLSFPHALAIGAVTPILSSLLTGMPPISPPILYIMIFELAFLAGVISLLHQRSHWGLFWILLIGLLVSRLVLLAGVLVLAPLLGLPPKVFSLLSVIKGLPGIGLMLVLIPLLVNRTRHEALFLSRK